MALAHTILTVLCEKDASGYDISKQFEETMACYWTASQQQIYRELARIEANGWVRCQVVPQQGKPDRKVYAITEAGRQELRHWAAEPAEPTPIREDLLVKVLGGPYADPAQLLAEVRRRRAVHDDRLASYLEKDALFRSHPDLPLQERYRHLTLRRGILFEQEWIRWCDEVIAFLEGQPQDQPPGPEG